MKNKLGVLECKQKSNDDNNKTRIERKNKKEWKGKQEKKKKKEKP